MYYLRGYPEPPASRQAQALDTSRSCTVGTKSVRPLGADKACCKPPAFRVSACHCQSNALSNWRRGSTAHSAGTGASHPETSCLLVEQQQSAGTPGLQPLFRAVAGKKVSRTEPLVPDETAVAIQHGEWEWGQCSPRQPWHHLASTSDGPCCGKTSQGSGQQCSGGMGDAALPHQQGLRPTLMQCIDGPHGCTHQPASSGDEGDSPEAEPNGTDSDAEAATSAAKLALMAEIMGTACPQELAAVMERARSGQWQQRGGVQPHTDPVLLDRTHISAALVHLAKLVQGATAPVTAGDWPVLRARLARLALNHQGSLKAHQASNMLWALGILASVPLPSPEPRTLPELLVAGNVGSAQRQGAGGAQAHFEAAAQGGDYQLSPAQQHGAEVPQAAEQGCDDPVLRLATALLTVLQQQWPRCNPEDVAQALVGLARLKLQPSAGWLQACMARSQALMAEQQHSPLQLTMMLWALAALGRMPPAEWVAAFAQASLPLLPSFTTQQLSNVVWACGALHLVPLAEYQEQLLACFLNSLRASQPATAPPAVAEVAAGAAGGAAPTVPRSSRLRVSLPPSSQVPPPAAAAGSPPPSPLPISQHISSMLWGLARLGAKVPGTWLAAVMEEGLLPAMQRGQASLHALAIAAWAMSWLAPGASNRTWLPALLAAADARWAELTPQTLFSLLTGVARLSKRSAPAAWVQSCTAAVLEAAPRWRLHSSQVLVVAEAVAQLGQPPAPGFDKLVLQAASRAPLDGSVASLACLLACMPQLGVQPEPVWLRTAAWQLQQGGLLEGRRCGARTACLLLSSLGALGAPVGWSPPLDLVARLLGHAAAVVARDSCRGSGEDSFDLPAAESLPAECLADALWVASLACPNLAQQRQQQPISGSSSGSGSSGGSLQQLCSALEVLVQPERLHPSSLTCRGIGRALHACCVLGASPGPAWLAAITARLQTHLKSLGTLSPAELAMMLAALRRLQRPGSSGRSSLGIAQGSSSLDPARGPMPTASYSLSSTSGSSMDGGSDSSGHVHSHLHHLMHTMQAALPQLPMPAIVRLGTAMVGLRLAPGVRWFEALDAATQSRMAEVNVTAHDHLLLLAWRCSGASPPSQAWAEAWFSASQARLHQLSMAEMVLVVRLAGALPGPCPAGWLERLQAVAATAVAGGAKEAAAGVAEGAAGAVERLQDCVLLGAQLAQAVHARGVAVSDGLASALLLAFHAAASDPQTLIQEPPSQPPSSTLSATASRTTTNSKVSQNSASNTSSSSSAANRGSSQRPQLQHLASSMRLVLALQAPAARLTPRGSPPVVHQAMAMLMEHLVSCPPHTLLRAASMAASTAAAAASSPRDLAAQMSADTASLAPLSVLMAAPSSGPGAGGKPGAPRAAHPIPGPRSPQQPRVDLGQLLEAVYGECCTLATSRTPLPALQAMDDRGIGDVRVASAAMVVEAVARWGAPASGSWLEALVAEVAGVVEHWPGLVTDAAQVSRLLKCVVLLRGRVPAPALSALLSSCQPSLPHCPPPQLVDLMWALGALDLPPPSAWLDGYCQVTQPLLPSMPPTALTELCCALATLRLHPPPRWLEALRAACFQHLLATARLPHHAPSPGPASPQQPQQPPPAFSPGQLATLAWALGSMGLRPPRRWMGALLGAMEPRLPELSSPELTMAAYGVARLGCRPHHAWLSRFLGAVEARVGDFRPGPITQLLSSLSSLDCALPPALLSRLVAQAMRGLDEVAPGGLAELAAAAWQLDESEGQAASRPLRRLADLVLREVHGVEGGLPSGLLRPDERGGAQGEVQEAAVEGDAERSGDAAKAGAVRTGGGSAARDTAAGRAHSRLPRPGVLKGVALRQRRGSGVRWRRREQEGGSP